MGKVQRITDTDIYAAKNHERGFLFGFWDLETTSLNASFGHILCNTVVGVDGESVTRRIDQMKSWKTEPWSDKSLCAQIKQDLEEYDVLISYNGYNFDIPFINTRLIANRMQTLDVSVKHVDLIMVAKRRMRLSGNSLDSLLGTLHAEHRKTPLDPETWRRAVGGDKSALDSIVEHNIADVLALREAFFKLKPFLDIQFRLIR